MKKIVFVSLSALVLVGCGSKGTETAQEDVSTENVEVQADSSKTDTAEEIEGLEESNESSEGVEAVEENESGKMTVYKTVTDVAEMKISGDMQFTVKGIRKAQFEPKDDFVELFGGENLGVIVVDLGVENMSSETLMVYPNQGTIVTDTKKQIDADILMSDDVGGEYFGEVVKDGNVMFLFDGDASEIESFEYRFDAPVNEDFSAVGDDVIFELSF